MKIVYIIKLIDERIIKLSKKMDERKHNLNIGGIRIKELETLRKVIQSEFKEDIRLELFKERLENTAKNKTNGK